MGPGPDPPIEMGLGMPAVYLAYSTLFAVDSTCDAAFRFQYCSNLSLSLRMR